jgi:dTDP-glucose pyrophosphorylase
MKPTLLILAAGMGSRYGGLKQIDPVGPNGEIIIDYSIYDAIRAGFGKLVFVIRHYFEDAFKEKIGSKFDGVVETAYAYQELDSCVEGFKIPAGREKPWGTAHAILTSKDVIDEPFAVINADDYYGPNSFKIMADFLSRPDKSDGEYSMVGFVLRNTLSEYGTVARGVCECDDDMLLKSVTERTKVRKADDAAEYVDEDGKWHLLTGDETVSMNLWGFQPCFFDYLQEDFRRYLNEHGNENKAEFFITIPVDRLIHQGKATVEVLKTPDRWFGVTYRADKEIAVASINNLIQQGLYTAKLWEQ